MNEIVEKYGRWNFEFDGEDLLVCEGLHGNEEHCEQYLKRLTFQEAFHIIVELREECLRLSNNEH